MPEEQDLNVEKQLLEQRAALLSDEQRRTLKRFIWLRRLVCLLIVAATVVVMVVFGQRADAERAIRKRAPTDSTAYREAQERLYTDIGVQEAAYKIGALAFIGAEVIFLVLRKRKYEYCTRKLYRALGRWERKSPHERRYIGTVSPGLTYIVGYDYKRKCRRIEIDDATGQIIHEPGWPIGTKGIAIFRITDEEFEKKDLPLYQTPLPHKNIWLDELVKRLLTEMPRDRLLYYGGPRWSNVGGPVEPTAPAPTQPSDSGLRAAPPLESSAPQRSQPQSANDDARKRALYPVWVLEVARPHGNVPYLNEDACALFYTAEAAAQAVVEALRFPELVSVRYASPEEFEAELRRWVRLGVREMLLDWNPGSGKYRFKLQRDQVLEQENRHYGTDFNRLTLGYQFDMARGNGFGVDGKWSAMKDWLASRGLVLTPVHVEGRDENTPDPVLHYSSQAAFDLMNRYAVERELGETLGANRQVRPTGPDGNPVLLFHPEWFCGAEGCRFTKPGVDEPRRISPLVLEGGGMTLLCGFFDLESMQAIYGKNVSAGVYTFTELARRVGETDVGGHRVAGVVLSPGLTDLLLDENRIADYMNYLQDPYVFHRIEKQEGENQA